jgi:hypothetical protein
MRFRASENTLFGITFGPKRKYQRAGEICIMSRFIIYTLLQVLIIGHINEDEMSMTCRTCGKMKNAYEILDEKSEGKSPFENRWEDNIKMDL